MSTSSLSSNGFSERLIKLAPKKLIPVLERGIEMMKISAAVAQTKADFDQIHEARLLWFFTAGYADGLTKASRFLRQLDLINPADSIVVLDNGLEISILLGDIAEDLQGELEAASLLKSFYQAKLCKPNN